MVQGLRGLLVALALSGCTSFTGIEEEPAPSSTGSDETSAGPGDGPSPSTMDGSDTASGSQTSTSASGTSGTTGSASDSADTEATTDVDTTSSTSGQAESDTTQGVSETTGGVCAEQDMEPNDTFDERQDLGVQACGADPSTASGTLLDENDIDYFWFQSPWNATDCGTLEPNHAYSVNGPVELCVALDCPGVAGTLTCEDGSFEALDGYNFCCGTGSLDIDIFCDSTNESTVGFIRVRPDPEAPACADYSFEYEVYFD